MKWIVTTNSSTCRIYQMGNGPTSLTLIKEILHPENRQKKSEFLTSERPGRYQSDPAVRGNFSPHSDPKEVEIDKFSREIAVTLNQGRNENAYEHLVIVAPPHMEGMILRNLDKHVSERISHKIQKDVMQLKLSELQDFLREHRWE